MPDAVVPEEPRTRGVAGAPSEAAPRVPRALVPLHVVALGAVLAAARFVILPFWIWIVLALWTSALAAPLRAPVMGVVRGKKRAAAVVTLALVLAVVIPLVLTILPITSEALAFGRRLLGAPDARRMLESLVEDGGPTTPESWPDVLRFVGSHESRVWPLLRRVAGATTHVVAGVSVFVVTAYVRLAHGDEVDAWTVRHVPVAPRHLRRLAAAFSETGRGLFVGVAGAALAQNVIATITYAVVGVPHALVLGVLGFLSSLVPGIGAALVWGPVAVALALVGRTTAAIVVAAVGIALVSTIDNVLKPVLARYGRLDLPAWLLFLSMLGGLLAIGPKGILLGPIAVRIAKELLVIAREEREAALP